MLKGLDFEVFDVVTPKVINTDLTIVFRSVRTCVMVGTIAELGFKDGASREAVYDALSRAGAGPMDGYVAIKAMGFLRPSDGTVRIWTDRARRVASGQYLFGFRARLSSKHRFVSKHDIGNLQEMLSAECRIAAAFRPDSSH